MSRQNQSLTIAFLGCGKLNTAILEGIVASLAQETAATSSTLQTDAATSNADISRGKPTVRPTLLIACVRQTLSASRLQERLVSKSSVCQFEVLVNENVRAVALSDIVLLGVKPNVYHELLSEPGMRNALAGKILVSVMVGVTAESIKHSIYGSAPVSSVSGEEMQCHIVTCIPNTAAALRHSMTIMFENEHDVPQQITERVDSIFALVGKVKHMPVSLASAAGALAGSTAAFHAWVLEGLVDGAVNLGIDKVDATEIAAAAMGGAAAMISAGESPSEVRQKIATPGGTTAAGLSLLQEAELPSLLSKAIVRSSSAATKLSGKEEGSS